MSVMEHVCEGQYRIGCVCEGQGQGVCLCSMCEGGKEDV